MSSDEIKNNKDKQFSSLTVSAMKSSTENVKHYFLLYSVPPLLKSEGFPQIFLHDTLYITLVEMACKLILKFLSNDIIFLLV